jgi:hypothetical protein
MVDNLVGVWLPVIGQLQQLTCLEMYKLHASLDGAQHLPASLVELAFPNFHACHVSQHDADEASDGGVEAGGEEADVKGAEVNDGAGGLAAPDQHAADSGDGRQFDLGHLTRLTRLVLGLDISGIHQEQQPVRVDALLPLQLLQLDVSCYRCAVLPMLNLAALRQLRRLILAECVESNDSLLSLNKLSSLTDVELGYKAVLGDVEGFRAWAQLSRPHSLKLTSLLGEGQQVGAGGGEGFMRVMQAAGKATSLRQLRLDFREGIAAYAMRHKLFGFLTGLRQLKELSVLCLATPGPRHAADPLNAEADDAMHLTALTGLAHLHVFGRRAGDVAAVALACHLSELQSLCLNHCGLESRASLPAIAKLVQLRHLDLSINALGSGGCLKLLTQLTALTFMQLWGTQGGRPSNQEIDDFWAAVQGQGS